MNDSTPDPTGEPAEPPGRVLAVDDDPGVRRLVAKVLRARGYAVDTAEGVDPALDRLAGAPYDVALVDLNMPGRPGLDLLAAIAAGGIPVVPVLLTGTADVGAAVAGMKGGAYDYLPKPVDPDALGWAVARALEAARARARERALERVVSEWAATFDACPDALLVLGAGGGVLRANAAAGRAAGAAPQHLIGRPVADAFPAELAAAVRDLQRHPGPARPPAVAVDPGRGARYLVTADPVGAGAGTWVVVLRDVTEQVRGAEERKALLRRVLSAQEDERRRIARELHDGIGQSLVSLAVGLEAALPGAPAARLQQVAADALAEIRGLAHGLRPAVLDDLGLAPALGRLTETFTQVHGVRAELLTPDGAAAARLPTEVESALYRIAQEALANVAKHAGARTVDVVLEADGGWARVSVSDDGRGLPAGGPAGDGSGLSGMRERAVLLGGTFRAASAPGRGTTVDVRIPIPENGPCREPG